MALSFHREARVQGRAPDRPGSLRATRWRAALLLVAGVLLGHGAMLAGWPAAPGAGTHGDTGRPLQVRQISLPPATPDAPVAATTAAAQAAPVAATTAAAQAAPVVPQRRGRKDPVAAQDPPLPASPPDAALIPEPGATAPGTQAAVQSHEAAPQRDPGGVAVPVYATRLPPSTTLRYALRRSGVPGHAELRWINDGAQYRLSLRNEAAGALNLGSASSGRIDADGLAPERHTDSRRGRDVRAVNFQRDTARITFSGPSGEVPLVAGAQDRLSWMLQLAGIAEANPALRAPGSEIAVFVVGTRGDAEVWLYTVVGPEAIELPAGGVPDALHLRREPRRLYDTTVDVWLDPARQHLPVRARLHVRPTGTETVLMLESAAAL